MTIYKFHANTRGSSGELDLNFLEYATSHRRQPDGEYLHGLPIFTGRADTATHLRIGLSQPRELLELRGSGVALRRVQYTSILEAAKITDHQLAFEVIISTSEGPPSVYFGETYTDVMEVLSNPPPEAADKMLVTAGIVLNPETETGQRELKTWAICPADVNLDKCFVAREALSGTLVIAAGEEGKYRVVAYPTVIDTLRIANLVKMDEHGRIDLTSPGLFSGVEGATFQGYIEEESVVAF
jgi:hypothetical protein